jgi:hypothetical protein
MSRTSRSSRVLAALFLAALSTSTLAADEEKPAATGTEKPGATATDPMAGWVPRTVKREAADRKEIMTLLRTMEDAWKRGDLDAAVALIDFPVLMVTDSSKDQAFGETWDRERWVKEMAPMYKPNPGMKVAHRATVFLVTDALTSASDESTMTMGPKKITSRSAMLLVRKDGKWRVKSMIEGGWGDAMASHERASGEK